MRDHGSIRLFLGNGVYLVGTLALSVFDFFLFCFCLLWGEQVTDAQDLGWQSKGEDHFRSWFPFFYLVTILYCSDIVWSKDFSAYFFCFYSNPWLGIFFLLFFFFFFAFSRSLIGNFLFLLPLFCFLPRARIDILTLGQDLW